LSPTCDNKDQYSNADRSIPKKENIKPLQNRARLWIIGSISRHRCPLSDASLGHPSPVFDRLILSTRYISPSSRHRGSRAPSSHCHSSTKKYRLGAAAGLTAHARILCKKAQGVGGTRQTVFNAGAATERDTLAYVDGRFADPRKRSCGSCLRTGTGIANAFACAVNPATRTTLMEKYRRSDYVDVTHLPATAGELDLFGREWLPERPRKADRSARRSECILAQRAIGPCMTRACHRMASAAWPRDEGRRPSRDLMDVRGTRRLCSADLGLLSYYATRAPYLDAV